MIRTAVMVGVLFVMVVSLSCPAVVRAEDPDASFFSKLDVYPDLFADHHREVLFLEHAAGQPPAIDGQLDDTAWQQAARFEGLHELESGLPAPAEMATEGWVLRSPQGLYLAVRARRQPLPPALPDGSGKVDPAHPDLADQGLDTFSFQFNPDIHEFTRRRFTVGPHGVKRALRDFLVPVWNPTNWAAAYQSTDSHITIECFIPWELLRDQPPAEGDVLAFNLHRYSQNFVPVPGGPYRYKVGDHYVWQSARCHSIETVDHHPWLYLGSKQAYESDPPLPVLRAYLDKVVYDDRDEAAEAYVEIRGQRVHLSDTQLVVAIVDEEGQLIHETQFDSPASPDVGFGYQVASLPVGRYTLQAKLQRQDRMLAQGTRAFQVSPSQEKATPKPDTIDLVLTEEDAMGTGTRPISTGIPFPRGMLFEKDLSQLMVERRLSSPWQPVDAAFTIRNRWYRGGSIRWLGVDFAAEYDNGHAKGDTSSGQMSAPAYRLRLNGKAPQPEKKLLVQENDEDITVVTGPLKAVLSKNHFNLVNQAWLDRNNDGQFTAEEQLIASGERDGLHSTLVDGQAIQGNAAHSRLWVEEANAMRAVIVAQGDYHADGKLTGQHLTRFFFERDQPTIKINHTFILTHDTHTTQLRHAGLQLGISGIQGYVLASETGAPFTGQLIGSRSVYMLQANHDHFVVEEEIPGKQVGRQLHEGQHSAGWATARTSQGGVQLIGRRLWQLFPKELEIGDAFLALHLWPRHGRDVFTQEQLQSPVGATQARFAHQGRDLNLQTPMAIYHTMGKAFSDPLIKANHASPVAPYAGGYIFDYAHEAHEANGQGMAISVELCIRLLDDSQAASTDDQASFARAYQADPMATADPRWLHASRVLGDLWPRDTQRFAKVEAAIDERFDEMMIRKTDQLGDYGTFIWPDIHTYAAADVQGEVDPNIFHRTWIGTHYQEGRTYYQLFLRSGLHKYWRYARDSARHRMDVSTVNYASDPRVGKNQTPWGNYHVYGVLPWAGMQGISCHYQNLDYKTWDSFLTGDPRGLMQARGWAQEMARTTWANEPTRDALVPVSEALEVYQATHYAPLLKTIHWFKEAAVAAPIAQATLPFFSELAWVRMHERTRDPRVAQRFIEHWGDGNTAKRNGMGGFANMALFYQLTGDDRIASLLTFPNASAEAYLPSTIPPRLTRSMMTLPFAMSVLSRLDANEEVIIRRDASDAFWQSAVERWRKEGKRRWGEP